MAPTAPLQAVARHRVAAADMPLNTCRLRASICYLPGAARLSLEPARTTSSIGQFVAEAGMSHLTIHDIDFTIYDEDKDRCDGRPDPSRMPHALR